MLNVDYKTIEIKTNPLDKVKIRNHSEEHEEISQIPKLFQFFLDLKKSYDSGVDPDDLENQITILSHYLDDFDEDYLPNNFNSFFFDNDFGFILLNLLQNSPNMEIFYRAMVITSHLFSFLITFKNDYFCDFFDKNGLLNILFSIRQSLEFDMMPVYFHLLGVYSYFSRNARDQIVQAFDSDLLERFVFGVENCDSIHDSEHSIEISYMIMRMTAYPFSTENKLFCLWVLDIFIKGYLLFSPKMLDYFIRAIQNLIYFNQEFNEESFYEILYKKGVYYIFNEMLANYKQFDDELIYDLLHTVKELAKHDIHKIEINYLILLEIVSHQTELSSSYSLKFMKKMIDYENRNSFFINQEAIHPLEEIFVNGNYQIKINTLDLINEILRTSDIHDTYIIAPFLLPFLVENLQIIDDNHIRIRILSVIDNIFLSGETAFQENHFYKIMDECGGIEFLHELQFDEDVAISNMAKYLYNEYIDDDDGEESNDNVNQVGNDHPRFDSDD